MAAKFVNLRRHSEIVRIMIETFKRDFIKWTFVLLPVIWLAMSNTSCSPKGNPTGVGNGASANIWGERADSAQDALQKYFWDPTHSLYYSNSGKGNDAAYWWQAHALDVLSDSWLRTSNPTYINRIMTLYSGFLKAHPGITTNYYDDMEWMALALLRAYNETGDNTYLNAVNTLWQSIKGGWSDTLGGGIRWRIAQPLFKNVPANAPASILASRLYEDFGDTADLAWAKRIQSWVKVNLVNPVTGAVIDGITYQPGSALVYHTQLYPYNYGTYLDACLELYKITKDTSYLNEAVRTANLADSTFALPDGILRDGGTGDGGLFKGIYVRYLVQLILEPDLNSSTKIQYEEFLEGNAESLWNSGRQPGTALFNHDWQSPPSGNVDLSVELSGIMLLEGEALVKGSE